MVPVVLLVIFSIVLIAFLIFTFIEALRLLAVGLLILCLLALVG